MHRLQHGFKHLPNVRGNNPMAFCGRVDSVGKIQLWFSSDSLQKKWDEVSLVLLRKLGKDSSESVEVITPPVGRDQHSSDNELHFRIFCPSSRQNLVEILTSGFEGNAPKSIVSTQGENQDINSAL